MSDEPRPKLASNNLIELRTVECKPLKSLFDALKENITDVILKFSPDGISTLTMDETHTVLVNLELEGDKFDHYYCKRTVKEDGDTKKSIGLGVSIPNINKILKTISGGDDILTWFHSEDSLDTMSILVSSKKKQEEMCYDLKLMDINEDDIAFEGNISEYPFVISMPCADFQRICRNLKSMNVEKVTITVKIDSKSGDYTLMFEGSSDIAANSTILRYGKYQKDQSVDDPEQLVFTRVPNDGQTFYRHVFLLEKLLNFSKCANTATVVKICMEQNAPMLMIFPIGQLGKVTFGLAPYEEDGEGGT